MRAEAGNEEAYSAGEAVVREVGEGELSLIIEAEVLVAGLVAAQGHGESGRGGRIEGTGGGRAEAHIKRWSSSDPRSAARLSAGAAAASRADAAIARPNLQAKRGGQVGR